MSPERRFGLDERGASIVLVALALIALMGATALAIDVGMLLTARTEAQRTADAAAHAGAVEWLQSNGDEATTRSVAQQVASINPVIGVPPDVSDADVEILPAEDKVRVTVWRTEDRGNPVSTFFARVLGHDTADVAAVAAARISNSSGAGCPLPLALIDEWNDVDVNDQWDAPPDQYIPYPQSGYTGYGTDDIGMLIEIKDPAQPDAGGPSYCQDSDAYEACKAFGDQSWDCWWVEAPPNQGGGGGYDLLAPRVQGCPDGGFEVGDHIWSASGAGNKQELVKVDFKQLVDSEPDVYWDPGDNCPKRGDPDSECLLTCKRCRTVPLVDPTTVQPDGGANTNAEISNWAAVFVEKVSCSANVDHGVGPEGQWNVYVRLMKSLGTGDDGRDGSLLKSIKIVE